MCFPEFCLKVQVVYGSLRVTHGLLRGPQTPTLSFSKKRNIPGTLYSLCNTVLQGFLTTFSISLALLLWFSCSLMSDSFRPHGLYIACQTPLSMRFLRQKYWSGLPFYSPGDLLDPGIELTYAALVGRIFLPLSYGKVHQKTIGGQIPAS